MTQAGHHNSDLELSGCRILEGGSWKHQRVVWLIPAGQSIDSKVYIAHRAVYGPPNQPLYPMLCQGMEVGEAYSAAIEAILTHPDLGTWEYVLTVEHDNVPPPDGLIKLLARMEAHPEFACIGGLYWTKGEGGCPQIWGDPKDPIQNYRPQPPRAGELVECCGTGMGFNLWRLSMFRDPRLTRPLFKTKCSREEGVGTQDLSFWSMARPLGYRCAIDCAVLVGHHDSKSGVTW